MILYCIMLAFVVNTLIARYAKKNQLSFVKIRVNNLDNFNNEKLST